MFLHFTFQIFISSLSFWGFLLIIFSFIVGLEEIEGGS